MAVVMVWMADVGVKCQFRYLSCVVLVLILGLFSFEQRAFFSGLFSIPQSASQCHIEESQRQPSWSKCGNFKSQAMAYLIANKLQIEKIRFNYSSLNTAYLFQARFVQGEILNSNWSNVNVFRGNFQQSKFVGNSLFGGSFISSDFSRSRWVGNLVENAIFIDASFAEARVHGTRFVNCDFRGADFKAADFSEATFLSSNLQGAVFNSQTKLPFPKDVALAYGMTYVE